MNEMILLGIMVAISIGMIAYALMPRKSEEEHERLLRRMSGRRAHQDAEAGPGSPRVSTARQVLEHVAPYAMKPVMPKSAEEMSNLRERLAQAGLRRETAVRYFLASKTLLGIMLAITAVIVCWSKGHTPKQVIGYLTMAGGVGFMLPNIWLMIAVSQRQTKIRNGLPDSLDLLVVSVESGLALDASLQRVGDEMHNVHGDLSEELRITTLETQMGVPRTEALENMARRCGLEEMQALVAVVSQAEKFGTSVAKALRTQADTLRVKRRQKAEERAQKTTVKLMLPLILFIFPSIFVVLVGPAAMKIMEAFKCGKLG
ncbi:MAG: type II secretion system F family protein [Phycisphaerales bacterium]|nr:type II secretion system F family protein [Phycisphaerales bacterium]